MKQITCPHCADTYPDFDVAHVCSKGPYAPELKRKLIGYTEREEGFYPMYDESQRGFITTAAFILCKYCRGAIASMGGPKYDAVCLTCYEKDPDERTN